MPKHAAALTPLPRPLTFVPIVDGPERGQTARVPLEADGGPVAEVTVGGTRYVSQRGVDGWEYVVER